MVRAAEVAGPALRRSSCSGFGRLCMILRGELDGGVGGSCGSPETCWRRDAAVGEASAARLVLHRAQSEGVPGCGAPLQRGRDKHGVGRGCASLEMGLHRGRCFMAAGRRCGKHALRQAPLSKVKSKMSGGCVRCCCTIHCKESGIELTYSLETTDAVMVVRNGDFVRFGRFAGKEWSRNLPNRLIRRLGTWEWFCSIGTVKNGASSGEAGQ